MARAGGKGGEVRISLIVDDQGTVKLVEAKRHVEDLGAKGEQAGAKSAEGGRKAAAGWDNATASAARYGAQLLAVIGISASIAGAVYLVRSAWDSWLNLMTRGIGAVDDYKRAVIGAASVMVDMTDVKKAPDLNKAYGAWKEYFEWLWHAATEADKKVAASGREVFEVGKELAKKGIVAVTQEQVETAGRLMDRIKSVAPLTGNMIAQVRAEIRDLLEGNVRMGSQLSQIFQQLDVDFKKNIENARKLGSEAVFKYLEDKLRGIQVAQGDIAATWESVASTMENAFNLILIEAFGSAYTEIVDMVKEFNEQLIQSGELTETGRKVSDALREVWERTREAIKEALKYFIEHPDEVIGNIKAIAAGVGEIAKAAITAAENFNALVANIRAAITWLRQLPGAMAEAGRAERRALGGIRGLGEMQDRTGMPDLRTGARALLQPKTGEHVPFMGGETVPPLETYGMAGGRVPAGIPGPKPAPPVPPVRPFAPGGEGGGGGGGGGGGRDTSQQLMSLLETLERELARAVGTAYEQVDRWYDSIIRKVEEYAMTAEDAEKGIALAKRVRAAKYQAIDEQYYDWLISQTHDAFKKIEREEDKVRKKFGEKPEIKAVFAGRVEEETLKRQADIMDAKRGQLQATLDLTSAYGDQRRILEEIADIEADIALKRLDGEQAVGKTTGELYEQRRQLIMLQREARKYQLALERPRGVRGAARAYRETRPGTEERQARSTIRLMENVERGLDKAAKSIGRALLGLEDADFGQIAKEFAAMFIDYLAEMLMSVISPVIEDMLSTVLEWVGGMIFPMFDEVGVGLVDDLTEGGNFLIEAGKAIFDFLVSAAKQMVDILGSIFKGIMSFLFFHAGGTVMHAGGDVYHVGGPVTQGGQVTNIGGPVTQGGQVLHVGGPVTQGGLAGAALGLAMAHAGLTIPAMAHTGLGTDERLVRAKVGEMIISPAATSRLEAQGAAGYVSRGELPPAGERRGATNITINANLPNQGPVEVERFARRMSAAIRRHERRRVA